MEFENLFRNLGEHRYFTPADRLHFYEDKPYFCFLEKGELDLFFLDARLPNAYEKYTVELNKNQERINFFRTLKEHQMLISFPVLPEANISVVGIPNSPSQLIYIPYDQFLNALRDSRELNAYFFPQLENWLNGFSEEIHTFYPPKGVTGLTHGPHLLHEKESYQCREQSEWGADKKHALSWIKMTKGAVHFFDLPNLSLQEDPGVFYPIIRNTWFKSVSPSEVDIHSFLELPFDERTMRGWQIFFQHMMEVVSLGLAVKKQKENVLLLMKRSLSQHNVNLAENQLQSVLEKNKVSLEKKSKSHLYDVCQFIGNMLNLRFDPSSREDPSLPMRERVEQLSFDSHIYQRLVRLTPGWFERDIGPLLAFSHDETKPLALIPNKGRYSIVDLDNPISQEINEQNAHELSSHAFQFYRAFPLKKILTGRDLIDFALFKKRAIFGGVMILSLLMTLLNLFFPFFNKILFDVVVPNGDSALLAQVFIAMLTITIGNEMFALGREYIILKLEGVLDCEFEAALWQRILDLPILFFRKFSIGDLLIRVFSISDIRKALSGQGMRIIINSLFSLVYLIPMIYYSLGLSFAGMIIILIGVLFSSWAVFKNLRFYGKILDLKAQMNNQLLQLLAGISKIKTYGAEKLVFILWEKIFFAIKSIEWRMQKVNNLSEAVNFTISSLGTLVIYGVAILLLKNEQGLLKMTMGDFLAFLAAFGPFSSAVASLSSAILETISLVPQWRKSQDLFKAELEVNSAKLIPYKLKGDIYIDHLSFRYDKNNPYILNNISLEVKEGEFIGIVGHSGCGKSTLVRLLIGFETPENGSIYFDNVNLSKLDPRHFRKKIGVVLQNGSLMDGTIQENITASGFYSDAEISRALVMAGFGEDLKRLPMGIYTLLMDNGNTLSGGQKQRLLIARALINQPKIVIFDEATNALDNQTQEIISQSLEQLNVTRIIVAHRLSRLKKADKIYVLNKGFIEDVGTFDELAARKGIFSDLLAKQKVS